MPEICQPKLATNKKTRKNSAFFQIQTAKEAVVPLSLVLYFLFRPSVDAANPKENGYDASSTATTNSRSNNSKTQAATEPKSSKSQTPQVKEIPIEIKSTTKPKNEEQKQKCSSKQQEEQKQKSSGKQQEEQKQKYSSKQQEEQKQKCSSKQQEEQKQKCSSKQQEEQKQKVTNKQQERPKQDSTVPPSPPQPPAPPMPPPPMPGLGTCTLTSSCITTDSSTSQQNTAHQTSGLPTLAVCGTLVTKWNIRGTPVKHKSIFGCKNDIKLT